VDEDLSKEMKAKAYHNLGNSYMQQKEWGKSVDAYKDALKINPSDQDTKYNLAYAKKHLIQQKQQQQKNKDQNKKDQNKKDQNKDKQNKDQRKINKTKRKRIK